jgi:drug/metabolite transporter (DMT)-like permease
MSLFALGLLLCSAALHTFWNLLLKQVDEKYIATWWATVAGAVCFLPAFFLGERLPLNILPYALMSALFEALYFMLLAGAYGIGDFSLVYPVARGTAPALLLLWSVLFLHEQPAPGGLLGISIVVAGLIVVGSGAWRNAHAAGIRPQRRSVWLALCIALCISLYSVIDGAAVKQVSPPPYIALTFALTSLFITPFIGKRYGWQAMWTVWRGNWGKLSLIGILSLTTYLLVLWAYTLAPVSYGGAIREISIIFAALAGWLWLREAFGRRRLIGAAIIFAGILIVAIAG